MPFPFDDVALGISFNNLRDHRSIKFLFRSDRFLERAMEACSCSKVTSGACLIDQVQQSVCVTIYENLDDSLHIPGCLPFLPQLLSRSAPVVCETGSHCLVEGLGIRVGDHQNFACCVVLHNNRDKSPILENRLVC